MTAPATGWSGFAARTEPLGLGRPIASIELDAGAESAALCYKVSISGPARHARYSYSVGKLR